jgi:hypothetical protein
MDITIVTSADTDEEALDLLKSMGMPFAEAKTHAPAGAAHAETPKQ